MMNRRQFLKAGTATAVAGAGVASGAISPPQQEAVRINSGLWANGLLERAVPDPPPYKELPAFAKALLKKIRKRQEKAANWQSDVHGLVSTSYAFKINQQRIRVEATKSEWDKFYEKYKDFVW